MTINVHKGPPPLKDRELRRVGWIAKLLTPPTERLWAKVRKKRFL